MSLKENVNCFAVPENQSFCAGPFTESEAVAEIQKRAADLPNFTFYVFKGKPIHSARVDTKVKIENLV